MYRCNCCGEELEIIEGRHIGICTYCGHEQVIPDIREEHILELFERADSCLMQGDFDNAENLYRSILEEYPDNALANWGCCLCRYGIRYTDDPETGKKIPTCSRTVPRSIFDEPFYTKAVLFANEEAASLFQKEAEYIDKVQKQIIAIVQKEEPYDVFISFKNETDDRKRTIDSILAQELYMHLTNEGYRVFYSNITLAEEHLGEAFEPYIYAALTTAKVMLLVASRKEYVESPWVRNEWSRFLGFMEQDSQKKLIFCYRDLHPEQDLPPELNGLQALDTSKIGYIEILKENIQKIISGSEKKRNVVQKEYNREEALLERADIFLKNGQFDQAKEYCGKVLLYRKDNAAAHWKKMLASNQLESEDALCHSIIISICLQRYRKNEKQRSGNITFNDTKAREAIIQALGQNMNNALEYADKAQKSEYEAVISNMIEAMRQMLLAKHYDEAMKCFNSGDFMNAHGQFSALGEFRDSKDMALKSREAQKNAIQKQHEQEKARTYAEAKALFESAEIQLCNIQMAPAGQYGDWLNQTLTASRQLAENNEEAEQKFRSVRDYCDAEKMAVQCRQKAEYFTNYYKKTKALYDQRRCRIVRIQQIVDLVILFLAVVLGVKAILTGNEDTVVHILKCLAVYAAVAPMDHMVRTKKTSKIPHGVFTAFLCVWILICILITSDFDLDAVFTVILMELILYSVVRIISGVICGLCIPKYLAINKGKHH